MVSRSVIKAIAAELAETIAFVCGRALLMDDKEKIV